MSTEMTNNCLKMPFGHTLKVPSKKKWRSPGIFSLIMFITSSDTKAQNECVAHSLACLKNGVVGWFSPRNVVPMVLRMDSFKKNSWISITFCGERGNLLASFLVNVRDTFGKDKSNSIALKLNEQKKTSQIYQTTIEIKNTYSSVVIFDLKISWHTDTFLSETGCASSTSCFSDSFFARALRFSSFVGWVCPIYESPKVHTIGSLTGCESQLDRR